MMLDLNRIRLDTPSANDHTHLDNCGAALMPSTVVVRMIEHIRLEQAIGGYDAQDKVSAELAAIYDNFAQLIGAKSGEVAILSSATDAWDRAFYSMDLASGDRVITGFNEYCSNFVALLHAKKKVGIEIVVINPNALGDLDLVALEAEAALGAKLIAISHVPSSSGQINPVKGVGKIAKKYSIPYLLDACQSLGQIKIDVGDIGCDMASFTSRKFLRGPRGVGALYISQAMRKKITPVFMTNLGAKWIDKESYEQIDSARVFEAWERNVAAYLGFGEAVKYLLALDQNSAFERIKTLSDKLRFGLAEIENVEITDIGTNLGAIVTCMVKGQPAKNVRAELMDNKITGQIASVFHTRLDLEARGIDECLRLSPHYYNTQEEIERTIALLAKIAQN
jgi:selenocysteine lyase/cysteine desulfurase